MKSLLALILSVTALSAYAGEVEIPRSMPEKGRYFLLEAKKEGNVIKALHKRVGPSGVGFSRTEANCATGQIRDIGYGDDSIANLKQYPAKMQNWYKGCYRCRLGLIILALLIFSFYGNTQMIISGRLMDSLHKPIAGATLSLVNKDSNLIIGYDISNAKGDFLIALNSKPSSLLKLSVDAIGFHSTIVDINDKSSGLTIFLKWQFQPLPNVTIKSRKTFLNMKPDTASYKTEDLFQKQGQHLVLTKHL
jgi:hypothetical protein